MPAEPKALPWPEVMAGEPGPLYGLFGEESFLVSQALAAFGNSPAFATNPDLNIERFHAADTKPEVVLQSALTLPFLGSRRLVMVQGLEGWSTPQVNVFVDYLKEPVDTCTLVFAGLKLLGSTKFGKALKKQGQLHVYKKMYVRQLLPWLDSRARLRGKTLERAARERLAELGGLGLGALDSEIEKLSLFVGEGKQITLDHVLAVTGRGLLYGIFDFTDAVAAGRLDRALSAYDRLHSLGEPPVKVLAMVIRLFKQLLQARAVVDQGGGPDQVQRAMHLPPAAARTLATRARKESPKSLSARLSLILAADAALKSSAGSNRVVMERLVMDLCAPKADPRAAKAQRGGLATRP